MWHLVWTYRMHIPTSDVFFARVLSDEVPKRLVFLCLHSSLKNLFVPREMVPFSSPFPLSPLGIVKWRTCCNASRPSHPGEVRTGHVSADGLYGTRRKRC